MKCNPDGSVGGWVGLNPLQEVGVMKCQDLRTGSGVRRSLNPLQEVGVMKSYIFSVILIHHVLIPFRKSG
ncbi:hypothetical protein CARN8_1340002 [mine drainage metagenome]|uniref:Uncharacterized protein n=1 Tax=mine drainage metagenome TaxID=410659 RepID=A0A3P3ZM61_9ZZZZ